MARTGNTVVLTFWGSAEAESLDQLAETLTSLHTDATRTVTASVIADIRELSFASASSLKVFIRWLASVQELEDDRRYTVKFRSNPTFMWQRRTLRALQAFACEVVEIEAHEAVEA